MASEWTGDYRGLFPITRLDDTSFDVSFSGLKSAVKREIDRRGILSDADVQEIAFEFREAVVRQLVDRLFSAVDHFYVRAVLITGGVSANTLLRERCLEMTQARGIPLFFPSRLAYCQDNAGMIGRYASLVSMASCPSSR